MYCRSVLCPNLVGLMLLVFAGMRAPATAQSVPPKLNLKADLVLTTAFCSAEMKRGNGWTTAKERFPVGEQLCPLLAADLPSLFASMEKSDKVPAPNTTDADVILVPKIGDIGATMGRKQELVVVLEWTALDRAGRPLWVQTIEGTAHEKAGSAFSHGKHVRLLNDAAVRDALAKSEEAIRSAPGLLKLAQ